MNFVDGLFVFCKLHDKVCEPKEKLTAHCARKYTMNLLAELSGMEPHKISFRCGLNMQNIHTFFDYVFRSRTMDEEVAKKLAGWTHKYDGQIFGGYPPSLRNVKTEKHLLRDFVKCLFADEDSEYALPDDVRDLLAASVFRYYREIKKFISNEPLGK